MPTILRIPKQASEKEVVETIDFLYDRRRLFAMLEADVTKIAETQGFRTDCIASHGMMALHSRINGNLWEVSLRLEPDTNMQLAFLLFTHGNWQSISCHTNTQYGMKDALIAFGRAGHTELNPRLSGLLEGLGAALWKTLDTFYLQNPHSPLKNSVSSIFFGNILNELKPD